MLIITALLACRSEDPAPPGAPPADTAAETGADTAGPTDTGTPPTDLEAPAFVSAPTLTPTAIGTVAVVRWQQAGVGDAELVIQVAGDADARRVALGTTRDGERAAWVAGVPYGADVTVEVELSNAAGSDVGSAAMRTPDLPATVPVPELRTDAAFDADVPFILVSVTQAGGNFTDPWWTLILDRAGRVVWARPSQQQRVSMHPRVAWHGDALLIDQNAFWGSFSFSDGSVEKLTLDGTVVTSWPTPGLHHPYQEMPDGSLYYGAYISPYTETIYRVDPQGNATFFWSCDDELESWGTSFCGSNTLNYDEATHSFLFSLFTVETVYQLDADTAEVLGVFGHMPDAWAFDPPESAFWFQHGAHFLDNGNLLVSSHAAEGFPELVAREYRLDPARQTLVEVWNVGVGGGIPGSQMGDAYRLPGGNTLQTFGTNAQLREYAPDGTVVWDLVFDTDNIGRATGLTDLWALLPPTP